MTTSRARFALRLGVLVGSRAGAIAGGTPPVPAAPVPAAPPLPPVVPAMADPWLAHGLSAAARVELRGFCADAVARGDVVGVILTQGRRVVGGKAATPGRTIAPTEPELPKALEESVDAIVAGLSPEGAPAR